MELVWLRQGRIVRIAADERIIVGLALPTAGLVIALALLVAEPTGARASRRSITVVAVAFADMALRLQATGIVRVAGRSGESSGRERERPRERCKVDGFLHWTVLPRMPQRAEATRKGVWK